MEKPKVADNKPMKMDVKPDEYYWCACGKSSKQPFCDGSHKGSSFVPEKVVISEEKTVYWCMCKHSKNKPFCDGTHNSLEE